MPEIPFAEVSYHPEYKRLAAIVGHQKLKGEDWDVWARIQGKHGWKRLLKAADRIEPLSRWPSSVEAMCDQLMREEVEAEMEWKAKQGRKAEMPLEQRRQEGQARAEEFAAVRKRIGA